MKDHQDVSPSTSVIIPDDHEESRIRKSMHQLLQGRTYGGKSSSLQNIAFAAELNPSAFDNKFACMKFRLLLVIKL